MQRRFGFLFALAAMFLLGRCAPAPDSYAATDGAADVEMGADAMPASPSVEGTYRLAYRDLPDGTRVDPPAIEGLMTFTAEYRNFNLMETAADGAVTTLGTFSRYSLTETEFTEELVFRVMTSGGEVMFEGAGAAASSPLTMDGDDMMWTMPLNEPAIHFMGDTFTATSEGAFVDYWERVE